MAKGVRRTKKVRTVEDAQQEIAQIELQIEMLKLDKRKLELEIQFLQNGEVTQTKPK